MVAVRVKFQYHLILQQHVESTIRSAGDYDRRDDDDDDVFGRECCWISPATERVQRLRLVAFM